MIEQVLYSNEVGDFGAGVWFVTALWPLEKQMDTADAANALQQETVPDAVEGSVAQVVSTGTEGGSITFVCRAGRQTGPIAYTPASGNGGRALTIHTDAELLRLKQASAGGKLEATMVHGTYLEAGSERLVSLPYPGNAQAVVAEDV